MVNDDEAQGVPFAEESDYGQRDDKKCGPPDDWQSPSWFDYKRREWWYHWPTGWRNDPPPVEPLGFKIGEFMFVTAARETRWFQAGQLYGRAGPGDLFAGDLRWATRHYPTKDRNGISIGRPNVQLLMDAMIRECTVAGIYDGATALRGIGTWRGPDGLPLIHTGGRIFHGGQLYRPGEKIGKDRYIIGATREAPAHVVVDGATYEWKPAAVAVGHLVMAHLDEWNWADQEARDLFAGGLWCDILGDAPFWKPHKFVRAPAGSGKTMLLKYVRELLGGAAHPIQRTYSKARLEEMFNHTVGAFLLEEAEGDKGTEAERMRRVLDLVLLMSDEGAVGGRFKRDIALHGTVTMIATLTEEWRTTIRSRMTLLELRRLRERADRPLASKELLEAMAEKAAELSAGLRARAIAHYPLFQENLKRVQAKILDMGGAPRDADQNGHMIAGWACLTGDEPLSDDELAGLERFRPYILTLSDAEDGADDAGNCWNTLLGLTLAKPWRPGEQLTIGEMIASAREPEGQDLRRVLKRTGLLLQKLKHELWSEAWLAVANNHAALDKLFADYPQYQGEKRWQILQHLQRTIDGVEQHAKSSGRPLYYFGLTSRAWLIPPQLLPTVEDEDS
jgi:hypothetical protein